MARGGKQGGEAAINMQLGQQVRDQVRSLFKIRTARQVGRMGPKPRIGATIFRGEVRITVPVGLSDDLWLWLAMQGWREPIVRPDRRNYRDVPPSLVTRLFDAPAHERMKVLTLAVARATNQPSINRTLGPRTIPASVVRR